MVGRAEPLRQRLASGIAVLALLAALVAAAFVALFTAAAQIEPRLLWEDVHLRRVVAFSFWQASLSTLLSVGLALPVARALSRRHEFPGREWLLKLLGLPLVVPTIVAVFGIVAVYGQSGLLNRVAGALGLPVGQYLYGLTGILIAHVFFNLPLAVRLLLPAWQSIPGETWRLAAQLGMESGHIVKHIEWPLLRQVVPQVSGLVFMLCFTSFAVVLTLGGGPAATTIEVAIYQALRYEFDLGQAGLLALLQLLFCALIVALIQLVGRTPHVEPLTGVRQLRPDLGGRGARAADYALVALAALSTLLPIIAVVMAGLTGPVLSVLGEWQTWRSLLLSLGIALCSASLAVAAAAAILVASRELRVNRYRDRSAEAMELGGSLILVVPPLVLGTGLFILLRPVVDVLAWAPVVVIGVNALMGMPYVIRLLGPPMTRITQRHDRLCASLGLGGWARFRIIEWPLLRAPIGLSLALCAALSTGDLGVIALFGSQQTTTLPLLLYQRLAAYRMDEAAVTALVLLLLCLALFVVIERSVAGRARA